MSSNRQAAACSPLLLAAAVILSCGYVADGAESSGLPAFGPSFWGSPPGSVATVCNPRTSLLSRTARLRGIGQLRADANFGRDAPLPETAQSLNLPILPQIPKISGSGGTSALPLMEIPPTQPVGLASPLLRAVASRRDEIAVVDAEGREISFGALTEEIVGIANTLLDRGVGRRHLVALHMSATVFLPAALFAVVLSGAAFVVLPARADAWTLQQLGVSFVISDGTQPPLDTLGDDVTTFGLQSLRNSIPCVDEAVEYLRDPPSLRALHEMVGLVCSAGHTGHPKYVEYGWQHLSRMLRAPRLMPYSRLVLRPTLGHVDTLQALVHAVATGTGVRLVGDGKPHRPGDPVCEEWAAALLDPKVRSMRVGETAVREIVRQASTDVGLAHLFFRNLHNLVVVGSRCPPHLLARLILLIPDSSPCEVATLYSQTEVGDIALNAGLRRAFLAKRDIALLKSAGSKIGKAVSLSEAGEVLVQRRPGYHTAWAWAGADQVVEGEGGQEWVRTGDSGAVDGEGRVVVTGRVGREQLENGMAAFEAEEALRDALWAEVDDVHCVVRGSGALELWAEVLPRVDRPKPGPGEVERWLALGRRAVYALAGVRVVAELPTTITGRVRRHTK